MAPGTAERAAADPRTPTVAHGDTGATGHPSRVVPEPGPGLGVSRDPLPGEAPETAGPTTTTTTDGEAGTAASFWQLVVDLATILLAVAAAYLAKREWDETRYKRRSEDFALLHKMLALDSTRVRRHLERVPLHPADERQLSREDLLVGRGWSWRPGWPLTRLAEVELVNAGVRAPEEFEAIKDAIRRSGILPRPEMSLAGNRLLFTSDRSFDAPSYGLAGQPQIDLPNGLLRLEITLGSYFDFIDTCLCFGYEAASQTADARRKLPLRQTYPMSELSNRHVQIGLTSLVVIRNVLTDGHRASWIVLHRRSADVAESAHLVNPAPAATFQPADLDPDHALDDDALREALVETLVREYCEELKNVEEFAQATSGAALRSRPEWSVLREATYVLGIGLNPLNAYAEIVCLTVLDAAKEGHRGIIGGEEIDAVRGNFTANFEGSLEFAPFTREHLGYYQRYYRSAPALRQLCRICLAGLDDETFRALTLSREASGG